MGTGYAGFQIQDNANSVQAEVEKAMKIFFKKEFKLTGSSRTDAGVHAHCNYFHFDSSDIFTKEKLSRFVYNLNAILPSGIVIKAISPVIDNAHCRFDALNRQYEYNIYQSKNPFLADRAFFYPYNIDIDKLNEAATLVKQHADFTTFSKRNTQVKTFICNIIDSNWAIKGDQITYNVSANRFLRGMVRGLVGTMLRVGTGRTSINEFDTIIQGRDCSRADFSVPPQGLFLVHVDFTPSLFI
jgi:tRNA pseudouridine38-40 synthase